MPGYSRRPEIIPVVNMTSYSFSGGTAVEIGNAARPAAGYETLDSVPLEIYRLSGRSRSWGVTTAPIAPYGCGEVQLTGVAPCRIGGSKILDYALPGPGGLVYADRGCRVIHPAATDTASLPLVVMDPQGKEAYCGTFQVVYGETDGTYRCIDGSRPDSVIAGRSDLGDVPVGNITPDEGVFYLYAWRENEKYMLGFDCPPEVSHGVFQLAHLDDSGEIVQDHTGGYIHWGRYYTV